MKSFVRTDDGSLMMDAGLFRLAPRLQRSGASRSGLRNSLLACDDLQVTHVGVYASLEVGGYAWAKRAAYAHEPEAHIEPLIARANHLVSIGHLDDADLKPLETTIREGGPDMMLKLTAVVGTNGRNLGQEILMGYQWDGYWDLTDLEHRSVIATALS